MHGKFGKVAMLPSEAGHEKRSAAESTDMWCTNNAWQSDQEWIHKQHTEDKDTVQNTQVGCQDEPTPTAQDQFQVLSVNIGSPYPTYPTYP